MIVIFKINYPFQKYGLTAEDFAEKLIMAEHVALVPGTAFGKSGAEHVRCSYATSIEKISEALNRIEHFLTKR